MTCLTLSELKIKGPKGMREIPPGEVISLNREKAFQLMNEGKITPLDWTGLKIHSDILEDDLWLIPDEAGIKALKVRGAVYTAEEVRILKGVPKEVLKRVHETKKVFPGSIVRQVKDTRP